MITLKKMTADYVDREDRIALTGEAEDGRIIRLWLIRPLTRQLAVALTDLLKLQSGEDRHAEAQEAFRQAAAEHQRKPMPAVQYITRKPSQRPSASLATAVLRAENGNEWLVLQIDAKLYSEGVTMSFHGADDEQIAGCGLSDELLRQWLGILRKVCHGAGWIGPDWPAWMNAPMILEEGSAAN
jgi:hypothetical protein